MLRPHHINLHIIITMCLKKGKEKEKKEIVVFKGLECLTTKTRAKTSRTKPAGQNQQDKTSRTKPAGQNQQDNGL